MSIYDVVCGKCGCHTFKGNYQNESECQGCGYVLTDDDIERLLIQATEEYKNSMEDADKDD